MRGAQEADENPLNSRSNRLNLELMMESHSRVTAARGLCEIFWWSPSNSTSDHIIKGFGTHASSIIRRAKDRMGHIAGGQA